jgi:choline-sulfatase
VIDPIDGRSLVPLLRGERDGWDNYVMVEFTAEGTFAPALILRQVAYKYVYCETDPSMMYDLENDPHELNNLCEDPAYSDRAKVMEAEVLKRWDPVTLKADIIASQQRRHFLQKTMQAGAAPMWDFQPFQDASKQYLRSGNSPTHVKGLARFPFVSPKRPDHPRAE